MAHTRKPVWAIALSSAGLILVVAAIIGVAETTNDVRGGPVREVAARGLTSTTRKAPGPELGDGRSGVRTPRPAPPTTTTTPPNVAVIPQSVRIPSIGVTAPLIGLGLNPDNTIEVPTDFSVAGWYIYRPVPGDPGPSVIAGHVDSRSGPAVFYRLKDVQLGAAIEVDRSDGSVATFTVVGKEQVAKNAFPTARVYGPTSGAEIRVITCGGAFDWSSRHYTDNLIVYGTLDHIA